MSIWTNYVINDKEFVNGYYFCTQYIIKMLFIDWNTLKSNDFKPIIG